MPLRDRPARRHVRLPGWDYRSPGPYAVTIVTQHREWFLGDVVDGRMVLNVAGSMVDAVWREAATRFPRVTLNAFIVMPNHLHAILHLSHEGPAGNPTLGDVVHRFKSVTTTRYSDGVHAFDWPPFDRTLWQPRFYDHIVRDAADLDRCRRYIAANPANWINDPDREPERPGETGE
jgi:REP element-mobilizing transposase RayT